MIFNEPRIMVHWIFLVSLVVRRMSSNNACQEPSSNDVNYYFLPQLQQVQRRNVEICLIAIKLYSRCNITLDTSNIYLYIYMYIHM